MTVRPDGTLHDDEVIWATSMTGEDFLCVHVDDWTLAKARIAELEADNKRHCDALRLIVGGEIDEGGNIRLRSDTMDIAHEALWPKA